MSDVQNLVANSANTVASIIDGRGMISLRGDLKSEGLRKAVNNITGLDIPESGQVQLVKGKSCVWMSPDELLLLFNIDEIQAATTALQTALADEHSLILNVSDARVIHEVTGMNVRDVLAKLTPANMSSSAFGPGQVRRTRIGQVAGAIWMLNEKTVQVISFRSTADYVFDLLNNAARKGAEVGFNRVAS